jgi:hypothetical protein
MARRRRRLRRVRYVPRRRGRARSNPGLTSTTMLLLAGAGIAGYFIWKKMKSGQVAVAPKPAGTQASVTVGGTTVTAQIPTSGYPAASPYGGGIFSSGGGLGSLG